jgi:hypothetical protein
MKPLKLSSLNPDNARQGHRYSLHFISVAISLSFQKLNTLNLWKKILKYPWPALYCFPRPQTSSYQTLFFLFRGLKNDISEVTTREEVTLKILVYRRILYRMSSISNCLLESPYSSFSKSHNLRFVYKEICPSFYMFQVRALKISFPRHKPTN